MRAAERTSRVDSGSGPTQTRMRSLAAQVAEIAWRSRYSRIAASTRSAVARSASWRSAIRLPLRKKVLRGVARLLRHVDLAFGEALEQLVGRQIDELDLVGAGEHAIGHGLAHVDAGDLRDDVVQAFEMLHVDRRVDVDAGREQLLDVLPALRMARARDGSRARARRR